MKDTAKNSAGPDLDFIRTESYFNLLDSTYKCLAAINLEPPPSTGLSPKELVWRKNKSKLYRYISPHQEYTYKTPLLMIYALINKAYILDLAPGMSVVEHLMQKGFDVYLLDWGEFAWEDRNLSFDDLVHHYIARAAEKVCQLSGTDQLSMLGYCMGGTMNAMYAGLSKHPEIKNMVYLATPIDFAESATAGKWLNSAGFDLDAVCNSLELIPSRFIDIGVKMLRPVDNFWGTYTRLWKSIAEEKPYYNWKLLDKWVNDNIHFPGKAFYQWVKDLYQENKLVKGEFELRQKPVRLSNIESSLLVLAGEKDHLVLPEQTTAVLDGSSSADKTYAPFPVGHGGLVFGGMAQREVYPYLANWLAERS